MSVPTQDKSSALLPVMGLWIGDALSDQERLSMASFVACGHTYKLYAYRAYDNIPSGVELLDANDIIPEKEIFKVNNYRGYSSFSNWFRWELLSRYVGWWADLDMVCLKPLDIHGELVAAFEDPNVDPETYDIRKQELRDELMPTKGYWVNNALIKCANPKHSVIMKIRRFCAEPEYFLYDRMRTRRQPVKNIARLLFAAGKSLSTGESMRPFLRKRYGSSFGGPWTFTDLLITTRTSANLLSAQSFYPVHWVHNQSLYDDTYADNTDPFPNAYAVHLWNASQKHDLRSEATHEISPNSFVGQMMTRLL